jgi:general stress protein 26
VTRGELVAFLRKHKLCVQASAGEGGAPQAAVVGFAVSDELEIVFDTLGTTRKAENLRRDPRVAIVVGWEEETAQLEGVADEPSGADLDRLKALYFGVYPDGVERQSWPGITYFRVRPSWARYSDFGPGRRVVELNHADLKGVG